MEDIREIINAEIGNNVAEIKGPSSSRLEEAEKQIDDLEDRVINRK